MSYIDVEVAEGRRCAGVITNLASQLSAYTEGQSCELCQILESFVSTLDVLAADLLEATDAYAAASQSAGGEKKGG